MCCIVNAIVYTHTACTKCSNNWSFLSFFTLLNCMWSAVSVCINFILPLKMYKATMIVASSIKIKYEILYCVCTHRFVYTQNLSHFTASCVVNHFALNLYAFSEVAKQKFQEDVAWRQSLEKLSVK